MQNNKKEIIILMYLIIRIHFMIIKIINLILQIIEVNKKSHSMEKKLLNIKIITVINMVNIKEEIVVIVCLVFS